MKTLRNAIPLLAMATALAVAPAAVGQEPEVEAEVVPPENSAVTQYTEAFPTAGGDRDAHAHEGRSASPGKVLGTRNARRLEREGRAGREVAELTVDTAPAPAPPVLDESQGTGGGKAGSGDAGKQPAGDPEPQPQRQSPSARSPTLTVDIPEASGSSGLGGVLERAVGGSPGDGGGPLLPLLVLATIVWAIAYASRQRPTAD